MKSKNISAKRVIIATVLGVICGLFCMYGTMMKFPGQFETAILLSIVYNRALIGFVIGLAGDIKMHPATRGAVLGTIVGTAMAISAGMDSLLILTLFSIAYGIIIDVVTTKLP